MITDQTSMPTPHSLTASGRSSDFGPIFNQSRLTKIPSSHPRISSEVSTCTTSQGMTPVSCIAWNWAQPPR